MAQPWFRYYHESLDDPKVQSLPAEDFKFWVNCLCLAQRNDGKLPDLASVSFAFRISLAEVEVRIKFMTSSGLLDNKRGILTPHNWNKRQYKSDSSTPRVKRFRKRFETVSETGTVTPPEQIQNRAETDTEQKGKEPLAISSPVVPKYSPEFSNFWSNSTMRGSKLEALAVWKKLRPDIETQTAIIRGMTAWQESEQWQDESKQPHVFRWLKRRGWEEIVPKRAIAENLRGGLIDRPFIEEHTTHVCNNCDIAHEWPCDQLGLCTASRDRSCPEFVGRYVRN